eukprot:gene15567-19888_t
MYTINENSNLVIELFNGTMYSEDNDNGGRPAYIVSPVGQAPPAHT